MNEEILNNKQLPVKYRNLYIPNRWSKEYIEKLIQDPSEPEDYPNALIDIKNCIDKIDIKNKIVLVVGSITPWIECFMLKLGASKVYTLDINQINIDDTRIVFYNNIYDLNKLCVDIIVSFSTVEHIGLGRYGDELDENGDIKFMDTLHGLLKNNGYFILAVPVANEYKCHFPAHRIYDSNRLLKLINKYKVIMSSKNGQVFNDGFIDYGFDERSNYFDWQNQPAILLRK